MPEEDMVMFNGVPMRREAAEYLQEVQRQTHYLLDGRKYPRVPYGQETFRDPVEAERQPCPHCDAVKGQLHHPLCDYEQCPVCENQVMGCACSLFTEDAVEG
jgi:hypothetical protein